jgi:hypothetical protein
MWIVVGVWECVLGLGVRRRQRKGRGRIEERSSKERGEEESSREERRLGGVGLGEGRDR